MKKNRINEIIPEYINQSKKYLKKYFDKITINRYLRDFENTASKDFSKIINSSRTLYKEVKNGREIKSTINLLSSTNLPFYNSIFSNKLYSEIKIENEREKLKKLLKDGLESRKTINLIKLKQVEGNIGETEKKYKNKLTEQIIKKKKNLSCDLEKKKLLSNYSYEQFKLDSQYLDNILSEDEKYITNQLNNYYQKKKKKKKTKNFF